MAGDREKVLTPIAAIADLTLCQYHAVRLTGAIATLGEHAIGINYSKPDSGDHMAVGYAGEMKFAAGAPCSLDQPLTVTTSGWIVPTSYGNVTVGRARAAVTSGSVGTGYFDFSKAFNGPSNPFTVTEYAAAAVTVGQAYAFSDHKIADTDLEANGVLQNTAAQSASATIVLFGKTKGTLANSYGTGQNLVVVTSGYFSAAASGYNVNAVTLTAAASGQLAEIFFYGSSGVKLA